MSSRLPTNVRAARGASEPRRGRRAAQAVRRAGIQYGPAFTGLAAAHTAEGPASTVLAEVGLPGPHPLSSRRAYGVHPALLDACFQSVVAHPDIQRAAGGGLLLPLGVRRLRAYGRARNARYCHTPGDQS